MIHQTSNNNFKAFHFIQFNFGYTELIRLSRCLSAGKESDILQTAYNSKIIPHNFCNSLGKKAFVRNYINSFLWWKLLQNWKRRQVFNVSILRLLKWLITNLSENKQYSLLMQNLCISLWIEAFINVRRRLLRIRDVNINAFSQLFITSLLCSCSGVVFSWALHCSDEILTVLF